MKTHSSDRFASSSRSTRLVFTLLKFGTLISSPLHAAPGAPPAPPTGNGAHAPGAMKAKISEKAASAKSKLAQKEKPTLSTEQQANLHKLKSDLTAIKAGSTVTEEQKQQLGASLQACVSGSTIPSQESTQALASSLSAAMADGKVSSTEKAQIAGAVQTVLASAGVPQAEVEALVANAQSILVSSGVSKETATQIANDLKAIGAEAKANAPAKP